MPKLPRLLVKLLITLAALGIILVGAAIWGVRLLDTYAPQYRQDIAAKISQSLDANTTIEQIKVGWHGSSPALKLSGVDIDAPLPNIKAIHAESIDIYIPLHRLIHGQLKPNTITLNRPKVILNTGSRQPRINRALKKLGQIKLGAMTAFGQYSDHIRIYNLSLITPQKPKLSQSGILASIDFAPKQAQLNLQIDQGPWLERLHIKGQINGDANQLDQANLKLEARGIDPDTLKKLLPEIADTPTNGARANLAINATWQDNHFEKAQLELNNDQPISTNNHVIFPALKAQVNARPEHGKNNEPITVFELAKIQGPKLDHTRGKFLVHWQNGQINGQVKHLPAQLFSPLLASLNTKAQLAGEFSAIDFKLAHNQPSGHLKFKDLALDSKPIHFGKISGQASLKNQQYRLAIDHGQGYLASRPFIHGKIKLSRLQGHFIWQPIDNGSKLIAKDVEIDRGPDQLKLAGNVVFAKKGAPVVDMFATLTTPDGSKILSHLPQDPKLPLHDLYDWLSTAVKSGNVVVRTYLDGPVDALFKDGGKHFGIAITGDDFTMEYKPGWPLLADGRGSVILQGKKLAIQINKSHMLGVDVGQINMDFADVLNPVLKLHGRVYDGNGNKMLSYLSHSPLKSKFGALVKALDIGGNADLDLHVDIPLEDDLGDIAVSGTITTHDNELSLAALPVPIKHINGQLFFDEDGLQADRVTGKLLGQSLATKISPAKNSSIDIDSRLNFDSKNLDTQLPDYWQNLVQGKTQADIKVNLEINGDINTATIKSSLDGLAVNLPAPFNKKGKQSLPVTVSRLADDTYQIDVNDVARGEVVFKDQQLYRATIGFGERAERPLPSGTGLWLGGDIDEFALDQWLKFYEAIAQLGYDQEADKGAQFLPFLGAKLNIGRLSLGSRYIKNVDFSVPAYSPQQGFKAQIKGHDAQGQIKWRPQQQVFDADFDHLYIHNDTSGTTDVAPSQADWTQQDPRKLPSLDVDIGHLRIGGNSFGKARLITQQYDKGWKIKTAQVHGGVLELDASGDWSRNVGLTSASAAFSAYGYGLFDLIEVLGYEPPISAKKAALQGVLKIRPNDDGLNVGELNGVLSIKLKHGNVHSVDSFTSRALGLLNPHMLSRRLGLDFRDVFGKGLAFDEIKGDFDIINGDSFTDNLKITIPAAKIRMMGRIGLAKQDYDQDVTITPHIGGGIALASGVVGGPVVGLGVLALSEIFQKPIKKFSKKTYKLKGSWKDPQFIDPSDNSKQ